MCLQCGKLISCGLQVLVLAFAASLAIGAWIEGGVLAVLILVDITIGFFQDLQAARIVASLKSLHTPAASVLREGKHETVDATEVVPGDMTIAGFAMLER